MMMKAIGRLCSSTRFFDRLLDLIVVANVLHFGDCKPQNDECPAYQNNMYVTTTC